MFLGVRTHSAARSDHRSLTFQKTRYSHGAMPTLMALLPFAAKCVPILSTKGDDADGALLHPVICRLLDEFGERDDLRLALESNIHTYGWSGSSADHYTRFQEPFERLRTHPKVHCTGVGGEDAWSDRAVYHVRDDSRRRTGGARRLVRLAGRQLALRARFFVREISAGFRASSSRSAASSERSVGQP